MALFPIFSFVELNKDNVIRTFIATIIISACIFPIISILGFGESAYYEGNQDRTAAPIAAMINAAMYIIVVSAGYYLHKKFKSDLPQPLIVWAVI